MSASIISEDKNIKESHADLFLNISQQLKDYNGIEYLQNLLELITSHYDMNHGAIYEVVREPHHTLIKLIENKTISIEINNELNCLDTSTYEYLIAQECLFYVQGENGRFDKLFNNIKTFISIPLHDANRMVIGVMLLASDRVIHFSENYKEILSLFRSRVSLELDRFRLSFSLEYARDQSRYIANLSRDMIWTMDTEGFYSYVNPACFEIYGYKSDEMLGHHYSEFIPKNLVTEFTELLNKNRQDDSVHKLITQHQSAKGYPVKLICTTKAIRDRNGELEGFTGTSTDITEFIRSQVLFKSNNELFSKVLSRLPVIFFRINEDARIIDIRGSGLKRLGVSDNDWIDKSSYGLFIGKEREIQLALKGEAVSFETEGELENNKWAFFVSLFFDSWSGIGAIGFCVDISEQKLTESKLEMLLNEKRELNQKLVKVQEEERRNLARELHDEFGQSITAVKSLAKAITAINSNQYSETRSLSNSIVDLSGKLYEVVNDMMRRLRPEIIDTLGLEAAINNCIDRSQLGVEGINCTVEFNGDLTSLDEVIKITIYRIVQECLTNILKYAMASNVKIVISRQHIEKQDRRKRHIYIDQVENRVSVHDVITVTVKDDGVGMNVEQAVSSYGNRKKVGLQGIEERVTALDGILNITSKPYEGVKLEAEIELGVSSKIIA